MRHRITSFHLQLLGATIITSPTAILCRWLGWLSSSSFEDEKVECLQAEVDEGALCVGEEAPEVGTHHTLPSRPIPQIKFLEHQHAQEKKGMTEGPTMEEFEN